MLGNAIPTPNELMVLCLLWKQGDLTVRQIREQLLPRKRLAYTTVLTIVNVLVRKGWLTRQRVGKADRYSPVLDERQGKLFVLQALADRMFDGSLGDVVDFIHSTKGQIPVPRLPDQVKVRESPVIRHLDVDLL